jgi:hypothetical protein
MKKVTIKFSIILFVLLFAGSVFGLDIALTPGSVNFGSVLREGFAQGSFKFSTYSEDPVTIMLYHSERDNPMNKWVNMYLPNGTTINISDRLSLDKNNPLVIFVTFEPGIDAPNGDYQTTIGATVEGNLDSTPAEGQTVAKIRTGVSVKLSGKIDDVESLSCQATNLEINSPELGEPVSFKSRIKNTGNVYLNPRLEIEIWDLQKTRLIKTIEGNLGQIKPTISAETQFDFDSSDIIPGDYIASINVRQCNIENKLISFKVLNVGSKSLDGIIKKINIPNFIYGFKPFAVKVSFENLGNSETVARFSGGIYKDNILIQILESERLSVKPKESIELDSGFFSPVENNIGEERYVFKGKVYYGNKQTEEFSKVFFVTNKEEEKQNTNWVLIIGMAAIILVLIAIVAKRRKG